VRPALPRPPSPTQPSPGGQRLGAERSAADSSELLTIPVVTMLLNVSVVSVRRQISAGELPAVRLRRSVPVATTDLDAYIEARRDVDRLSGRCASSTASPRSLSRTRLSPPLWARPSAVTGAGIPKWRGPFATR
jgi:excisionase family DNA binding protein